MSHHKTGCDVIFLLAVLVLVDWVDGVARQRFLDRSSKLPKRIDIFETTVLGQFREWAFYRAHPTWSKHVRHYRGYIPFEFYCQILD